MKKILIALVASLVLVLAVWQVIGLLSRQSKSVTLTYWDFWDENAVRATLGEFEATHPEVKVVYKLESPLNYRVRLQTQLREGVGPDVFPIHNSWLPMFTTDLSPAPIGTFNTTDYKKTFYLVVSDSFTSGAQILAAPLGIDGLALYYNEDILSAAGVAVPKSWSEFISAAVKLTVKDTGGSIKTAGAALGTTANVDYWSDILGLMLLQQPGVDLKSPRSDATFQALRFYTGFVTDPTKKVWDVNLPSSTAYFIQGNLAFYFAPFSKAAEIKISNPNLKFKVTPVPQLPGREVAWASFWGEAVSGRSLHPKEAWEFVKFLTSKEIVQSFAVPFARVDLVSQQSADPVLGAYVAQGSYYKFWYLASGTEDSGINEDMIKVWEVAVNGILQGKNSEDVLGTVSVGVKQVLDRYTKPVPSGQLK